MEETRKERRNKRENEEMRRWKEKFGDMEEKKDAERGEMEKGGRKIKLRDRRI